jgi:HEAT repeat protein
MRPRSDLERGLLRLVRDGGDRASWHWIATRVPLAGLPLEPDALATLKELAARGLVKRADVGGGMDRWTLTAAGQAVLDAPAPAADQDVLSLLRADIVTALRGLMPRAGDPLRLWESLRRAVDADPAVAKNAARAVMLFEEADRGAYLRELLADSRPEVRAAAFSAFVPPRVEAPGEAVHVVDDGTLDELLRQGLTDADRSVRSEAARTAFAAGRGAAVLGELVANMEAPERDLQWWVTLALGGARDPISLAQLERLAGGEDLRLAGAAVRALAARPDGHATWLAAMRDPRLEIWPSAAFALGRVATGVDPAALAELENDPRDEVQAALAAYRARAG